MKKALFDIYQYAKNYWHSNNSKLIDAINQIIQYNNITEESGYETIRTILMTYPELDINQRDYPNALPLHTACKYKKIEIARLLLQHGADPNVDTETSREIDSYDDPGIDLWLLKLILVKDPLVHVLSEWQTNTIAKPEEIETAITLINLLLKNGQKLYYVHFMLSIPFSLNTGYNLTEKFIQHGIYRGLIFRNGWIIETILNGENSKLLFTIDHMLKAGIPINYRNWDGETALFLAIIFAPSAFRYLLQKGATIGNMNQYMFQAISKGETDILRCLLEKGANATTGLFYLLNEVQILCFKKDTAHALFFLLTEYGANVNQLQFLKNVSPITEYEASIRLSLVKLMIERGAERHICIDEPQNDHNQELISLIQDYQPKKTLSLTTLTIKTFFKNPHLVTADTIAVLPEKLSNLLKGVDEEPDTRLTFQIR